MLQRRTLAGVADNSLIKKIRIHHIYNKTGIARVGDKVRASVVSKKPNSTHSRGEVVWGLVVTTAFRCNRIDGSTIKYSHNTVIILNKNGEMIHNRVVSKIFKEYNSKYNIASIEKAIKNRDLII